MQSPLSPERRSQVLKKVSWRLLPLVVASYLVAYIDRTSVSFAALCAEPPGDRWTVLQGLVDAEDATRLLLARELTIEEKREFVDLRIEGWLRALPEALSRELRREWSRLRELGKDDLELDAIERLVALERLRGSRGA